MTSTVIRSSGTMTLVDAPVVACVHCRFNTRKTRDANAVQRLVERLTRNGFERTRALWAVRGEDGQFEVFAGGTRLEAARLAGLETVPVMLHEGFTDEEISRRADEDNENDEYHQPVSPVDVWAEYARLRDEEGWTQERIAQAKGVSRTMIVFRLKLNAMPETIKRYVRQGELTEGHLTEIGQVLVDLHPWLTTQQAWEELASKAVYDKGKNGDKSVRAVREDVTLWREFIDYAAQVYASLPESVTLHRLNGSVATPYDFKAREAFVAALAERKARSLVKVKAAEQEVRSAIADNLAAYQRYVEAESTEAAVAASKAEQEQKLLSNFVHGDSVELLKGYDGPPVRLLLTDPPYGMDYQSNRRWKTKAPDRLKGDGEQEAMGLLTAAMQAAVLHLADDAHVLVFCNWEREPEVRQILQAAGLKVKGSLIWVKEEHSAGDVRGAFAPRHERIVHAVKGSPEVTPRIADVLEVARSRESNHPTEKPVALLQRLIESTTGENDLVMDPFAGCASTLVAAMRSGRDFWGAELEESYHEEGSARLLREADRHER